MMSSLQRSRNSSGQPVAFVPAWNGLVRDTGLEMPQSENYQVSLAEVTDDVRQAQHLRRAVFGAEYGASFLGADNQLDQDEFDVVCDHIIVRCRRTSEVVGTYRILLPQTAQAVGRYYSQGEFFMSRLERQLPGVAELGRSCVHPEHRNGAVIMLLWSAIARYMRWHQCTHLIGCASVSMRDGGVQAASLWDRFRAEFLIDPILEAFPKHPLPLDAIVRDSDAAPPPLMRAYLRVGARVCGEPSWDPDFNTADFLMLLDLSRIDPRYARHFGLSET